MEAVKATTPALATLSGGALAARPGAASRVGTPPFTCDVARRSVVPSVVLCASPFCPCPCVGYSGRRMARGSAAIDTDAGTVPSRHGDQDEPASLDVVGSGARPVGSAHSRRFLFPREDLFFRRPACGRGAAHKRVPGQAGILPPAGGIRLLSACFFALVSPRCGVVVSKDDEGDGDEGIEGGSNQIDGSGCGGG